MKRRLVAPFVAGAAFFGSWSALAGPPYITDDPEPVEHRH